MVKSKYTFEKRQRENARWRKKEDKALRRAEIKQEKAGTKPETQSEEPVPSDIPPDPQP
jgi:hypothetical protein